MIVRYDLILKHIVVHITTNELTNRRRYQTDRKFPLNRTQKFCCRLHYIILIKKLSISVLLVLLRRIQNTDY